MRKKLLALGATAVVADAAVLGISMSGAASPTAALPAPTTPIEHVVVLFPENISFDRCFGPARTPSTASVIGVHGGPGNAAVNGLSKALLNEETERASTPNASARPKP